MLAIAETAALAEWKLDQNSTQSLSIIELVKRGKEIEDLLKPFHGPSQASTSSTPAGTDANANTQHTSNTTATPAPTLFTEDLDMMPSLVANVFRAAAYLHLHSVISGIQPCVTEIRDFVKESLTTLKALFDFSATTYIRPAIHRSVVFAIFITGCLTDDVAERMFLDESIGAIWDGGGGIADEPGMANSGGAFGNLGTCRQAMRRVWEARANGVQFGAWKEILAGDDNILLV